MIDDESQMMVARGISNVNRSLTQRGLLLFE